MDIDNFLDSFKVRRQSSFSSLPNGTALGKDIFFMISFSQWRGTLKVVDSKGKEVRPDYRNYSDATFILLRSLSSIWEEMSLKMSWNTGKEEVFLDEHPHLIYQLLRCRNVVDCAMGLLSPAPGKYRCHVDIVHTSERRALSSLSLEPVEGEPLEVDEEDICLLTDSYAIAGDWIVEILPIGENYPKLPLMLQPFSSEVLLPYLSVFLSNFENVSFCIDGVPPVYSDTAIPTRPTIVFEKVDREGSLFLHLAQTIEEVPSNFMDDFAPTTVAVRLPGGGIGIRKVQYASELLDGAGLLKRILSYTHGKAEAKEEVYKDGNFFVIHGKIASPFLLGSLAELARQYVLVGTDKLTSFKVKPLSPKLRITGASGIDFLEGDCTVSLGGGDTLPLTLFLSQYNKDHYISLSDGNRAIIDPQWVKRVERLLAGRGPKTPEGGISFFDLPETISLLEEVPDCDIIRRSRAFYEGFNSLSTSVKVPTKSLSGKLRPYQEEGVKWLKYLYDNGMGGCLADDMGLGKTIQTIAVLCSVYPRVKAPSLIVMPRSLLFNWQSELSKFAPSLSVSLYYGQGRNLDDAMSSQVVLTTYAIVRNDIELLSGKKFHYVILDESQNIKNMTSQASQAVMSLRAEHRLALSGTPIENNLGELYSLFRFLLPGMFGTPADFESRYGFPIEKEFDSQAAAQLRRKIYPFIMRRLKKDVLQDLPDRVDQTMIVEMDEEHAAFYEMKRRYFSRSIKESIKKGGIEGNRFEILQALGELRRIASIPESLSEGTVHSSKIPFIGDALVEAVENGHKCVVFFNYIAGIELLGERLSDEGIEYAVMTGATTSRKEVVDKFQNSSTCKVLLMTLKTGGVGLNLTAADTVFIAEPWWNKAAEEQAIGRLHRIGQKFSVQTFSIVTRGTIEEKMRILQQRKADLFDRLITSDGLSPKSLSEEDIEFMLGDSLTS